MLFNESSGIDYPETGKNPELLPRNQKEGIIQLSRLEGLLKEAFKDPNIKDYGDYWGITLFYRTDSGENIKYFPEMGFVTRSSAGWEPKSYTEILDKLKRAGKHVDFVLEAFFDSADSYKFPESVQSWHQKAKKLAKEPIKPQDLESIGNILKSNNTSVAHSWLQVAKSHADQGLSYGNEIDEANKYAKKGKIILDKKELDEIETSFNINNLKHMKEILEREMKEGKDISIEWILSGYHSAKKLGEDTSFFQPFAQKVFPNFINYIKSELGYLENHFPSSQMVVEANLPVAKECAEIGGIQSQELEQLKKRYENWKKHKHRPKFI